VKKNRLPTSAAGTERELSKKFLSKMIFDGLIDEVKIYHAENKDRLAFKEIVAIYHNQSFSGGQHTNRHIILSILLPYSQITYKKSLIVR